MLESSRFVSRSFLSAVLSIVFVLFAAAPVVQAQTSSFSYQGRLTDDTGTPLDGNYDLTFELYDASSSGTQIGSTINKTGVPVDNGLFTVSLDFGSEAFRGGQPRWLEVTVGSEAISPRTKLEASPVALSMPGVTVDADGQIGVNDATPDARLALENGLADQTIHATSNTSSYVSALWADVDGSDANAIYATSSNSSNTRATIFVDSGNEGPGVYSYLSNSGNSEPAVHGASNGTGPAVLGDGLGNSEAGRFQDGNVSILDGSGNSEFVFRTNQRNSAGQLSMFESAGTETFEIVSDENGNDGSQLELRQDDGTTTFRLDAENTDNGGAWFQLANGDGSNTVLLRGQEENSNSSGGGVLKMYNGGSSNSKTIELDPDYGGGGGNHGRITTDEIEINGADLAEFFDVRNSSTTASKPQAGTVVSIDPEHPGELVVSDEARDRRVAGIISGAGDIRTGIRMGQEDTKAHGDQPVAIAGRVYVKANTSNGSIRPGDMLTTSATPGHAMRANPDEARGAILGKAMTGLKDGTGQVLVLVSLQ